MIKSKTREFVSDVSLKQGLTRQTLGKNGSPGVETLGLGEFFSFLAQQIRKTASRKKMDGVLLWKVSILFNKGLERKNRVLLRQGSILLQQIKWPKTLVGT